jgi:hypothetical protein
MGRLNNEETCSQRKTKTEIMSIQFKWKKKPSSVYEPCLHPYGVLPFSKKGRPPFPGVIE